MVTREEENNTTRNRRFSPIALRRNCQHFATERTMWGPLGFSGFYPTDHGVFGFGFSGFWEEA